MTTASDTARAPPRFRLRTFGTLRLVGSADETVLGDSGHQRRRLALLAVLAASGEHGRSRDQLLGLFWPEVTQSRARHSLEQLLYAIRTALDEDVFTGTNPVRLNAALLDSDVGGFTDALARGELETAVDLYRGPFLDGFYLTDAPAFEQWMETERARLNRGWMDALERLATKAEAANDFAAAARWRQKLIEADPVSSKHAVGLIRALEKAGDHASALRYAERYEALVEQELGTTVGPVVSRLVAEVRERAKTESVVARAVARPPRSPQVASLPEPPTVEPRTPRVSTRRRVAARYSIAVLVVAGLVLAATWWRQRGGVPSIAVLPLVNLSGDSRDAALVDGLSEELMGVVAKIHHLRVVAQGSAFVFKNSKLDARRIADSLQVENILEGSVQKAAQRIRVQMRLIDARDGSTRWTETYDRELEDIFLVQSDIAAAVARELDVRLGGSATEVLRRRPTRNIAAYELYLRGSDPALLRSDSGARLGLEYFKQAIVLDSTYAAAYAGVARMYLRLITGQRAATSARELHALAEEAARKAVALDDSLAEAHAAVGSVLVARYDLVPAEKELTRAATLDPTDRRVAQRLAILYAWEERPTEALAEAKRAVETDPLSSSAHVEVARAQCANRQYEEGLARLKRLEAVRPPLLRIPLYTAICHGMKGDWPAAVVALKPARENRGRGFLGFALARAGQRPEAETVLADLTNHWQRTKQGAFEVAVAYAGLRDYDRAFEWLDRAIDDLSLSEIIMLPVFDELHADPRFGRLRTRLQHQNL